MAGTVKTFTNHAISIKDNSSTDIVDPSKYKKIVNDAYDFLGNEEAFGIFKNVCLSEPELWKEFVKAGSAMTSQMEHPDYDQQKASFCDKMKSQNLEVVMIDGRYFSEKFSEICEKYSDTPQFNEKIIAEIKEVTEAMTYAVNKNVLTAEKKGMTVPKNLRLDTPSRKK